MSENQTRCARCGGEARPILYGFPTGEMFKDERRGGAVLGGCRVTPDSPTHSCALCHFVWSEGDPQITGVAAYLPGAPRREDRAR